MTKELKIIEIENKIASLKDKLFLTDYLAIKYAEGVFTFAEYADTLQKRQQWRAEINALETELKMLRG